MEELSTARRSQVDLLISHRSMMKSSSDIPLNRTPTPSQTELHYNSHRVMPSVLYKSISGNIPPPHYHSRGGVHQTRPWRFLSSSTARPVGLPYSISQQSLNSRSGCQCQCDSVRIQVSRFFFFLVSEKYNCTSLLRKEKVSSSFLCFAAGEKTLCYFVVRISK